MPSPLASGGLQPERSEQAKGDSYAVRSPARVPGTGSVGTSSVGPSSPLFFPHSPSPWFCRDRTWLPNLDGLGRPLPNDTRRETGFRPCWRRSHASPRHDGYWPPLGTRRLSTTSIRSGFTQGRADQPTQVSPTARETPPCRRVNGFPRSPGSSPRLSLIVGFDSSGHLGSSRDRTQPPRPSEIGGHDWRPLHHNHARNGVQESTEGDRPKALETMRRSSVEPP